MEDGDYWIYWTKSTYKVVLFKVELY
jgi:hypothetical protein